MTTQSVSFPACFDRFVCVGDRLTFRHGDFVFDATIRHDEDRNIDDDDCHNTDQNVTGCDDEQQKKLLEARAAWSRDEWFYCGVVLSVSHKCGARWGHLESLWGIEANYPDSDNSYLTEVANEMLPQAVAKIGELIEDLKNSISKLT